MCHPSSTANESAAAAAAAAADAPAAPPSSAKELSSEPTLGSEPIAPTTAPTTTDSSLQKIVDSLSATNAQLLATISELTAANAKLTASVSTQANAFDELATAMCQQLAAGVMNSSSNNPPLAAAPPPATPAPLPPSLQPTAAVMPIACDPFLLPQFAADESAAVGGKRKNKNAAARAKKRNAKKKKEDEYVPFPPFVANKRDPDDITEVRRKEYEVAKAEYEEKNPPPPPEPEPVDPMLAYQARPEDRISGGPKQRIDLTADGKPKQPHVNGRRKGDIPKYMSEDCGAYGPSSSVISTPSPPPFGGRGRGMNNLPSWMTNPGAQGNSRTVL
jgi:hypothetical protein